MKSKVFLEQVIWGTIGGIITAVLAELIGLVLTLQIGLSLFVLYSLGQTFREPATFRLFMHSWRSLKWWMVLIALFNIGMIVALGGFLADLSPWLGQGWTGLVFGKSINIVTAPIDALSAASPSLAPNWPLVVPILTTCFLVFLLLVLPNLARYEEKIFRQGRLNFWPILKSSVTFGLIHALVGIPLGYALALSVAGFSFALLYRENYKRLIAAGMSHDEATEHALDWPSATHNFYNSVIVTVLLVATWIPGA